DDRSPHEAPWPPCLDLGPLPQGPAGRVALALAHQRPGLLLARHPAPLLLCARAGHRAPPPERGWLPLARPPPLVGAGAGRVVPGRAGERRARGSASDPRGLPGNLPLQGDRQRRAPGRARAAADPGAGRPARRPDRPLLGRAPGSGGPRLPGHRGPGHALRRHRQPRPSARRAPSAPALPHPHPCAGRGGKGDGARLRGRPDGSVPLMAQAARKLRRHLLGARGRVVPPGDRGVRNPMDVRMRRRVETAAVLAVACIFAYAAWVGLTQAPPDREMGDVQRIMYAHVPMVQMMLLAGTILFVCSVLYLFRASWKTDALAEASAELALVFGAIGTTLGSIWGRPTWGVYWAWDPRLTTVAILLVALAGYLALRRFVDDPERRAVWAAVTAIVIAVDVPIIYFSVKWWKSLHQVQSNPRTVDPDMVHALRWNIIAFFLLFIVFLVARYRIALAARMRETTVPEAGPGARQAVAS